MTSQLIRLAPKVIHQWSSVILKTSRHHIFHLRRTISISSCYFVSKESESMVRVLNVAEKNDAAKSIAAILSRGGSSMREGLSRFNKIYEFEFRLRNQQVKMSMTSVSGHLLGVEFTGIFKKWHACKPVDLFSIPVEKQCSQDYMDIKRTLEREIRGCQSLIIWTDCDREGENIGFEIIQVCQAVKPSIKIYRATFSEITQHAVTRAINNLSDPNVRVSEAVDVRQELDLRIGAAFTRFQTLRLQKIFPEALKDQLISYGSCQFPTLGFVVERYKQVQSFIAEPFWKIKVRHNHEEGICADFNWKRVRLYNQRACQVLYDQCLENPVALVKDVQSRNKSKWRPQALDTVELEKLSSRKLKINAKEAMQIAEKLYTKGFISYPRTETNIFPKELDMNSLVQEQTRSDQWGAFAQGILDRGPNPRNGNKSDKAHPPIHPLKFTDTLQGNEGKVYEFIVRYFLACLSLDAQGHETTVEIELGGETFTTSGLMIIARNYLDVYPYEKWNAKQIPVYNVGDSFRPDQIEMVDGETCPPPLLTEADLIALMDKHGIGTDATHADHIETVKSRMYIGVQNDGRLVPGQLGMGLVEGYDSMGFEMSKPDLRAELEADLKLICEGRKQKDDVLQAQIAKYKEVFIKASEKAKKLDEALSPYLGEAEVVPEGDQEPMNQTMPSVVKQCPKCDRPMLLRTTKDSKKFYVGCSGYPDCKHSHWLPDFVLNVQATDHSCQICHPQQVKKLQFKFKPGRVPPSISTEYTGCIGGCDDDLNETLGIQNTQRSALASNSFLPYSQVTPATSRNSSFSSSLNSGSATRGTGSRGRGRGGSGTNRSGTGSSGSNSTTPHNFFQSCTSSTPAGVGNTPSQNSRTANSSSSSQNESGFHSNPNNNRTFHSFGNNTSFQSSSNTRNRPGSSNTSNTSGMQTTVSSFFSSQSSSSRKGGPGGISGGQRDSGMERSSENYSQRQQSFQGVGNNNHRFNSSLDPPSTSSSASISFNSGASMQENNVIVCNCGKDAILLTVRKEGPNTGRQFYTCFGKGEDKCKFFLWADDNNISPRPGPPSGQNFIDNNTQRPKPSSSSNSYQTDQWADDGEQEVLCHCAIPAKSLKVSKNGPNMGRYFFGCSKPRDQSCNFFKWDDNENRAPTTGNYQGQGQASPFTSNKRASNAGSNQPKKRNPPTCSLCGMPGHKRPKCPNNDTSYGFF